MLDVDLVSIDYLKDLTGRKQKNKMIAWLRKKGYEFEVGADGYPKVTKSFINKRLGGGADFGSLERKRGDVEALKKIMGVGR